MASGLVQAFLDACDPEVAADLAHDAELESVLAAHVATAKAAWPHIACDETKYVAHMGARLRGDVDLRQAVRGVHAADLWLSLACGSGDRKAIAEFEKLMAILPDALARLSNRAPVDEVAQTLRAKLLVAADGAPPKVLDYSGRGPLAGWLRISAIRTALSLGRKSDAAPADAVSREVLLGVPAAIDDPELLHLRERYEQEFKVAFEAALRSLTSEDRNILRLSLVDTLSIDEIGAIFRVHRATAARWLAKAKNEVHERTREILKERLKISDTDFNSLMNLIASQLDLSIQRLLLLEDEGMVEPYSSSHIPIPGRKPRKPKKKQ